MGKAFLMIMVIGIAALIALSSGDNHDVPGRHGSKTNLCQLVQITEGLQDGLFLTLLDLLFAFLGQFSRRPPALQRPVWFFRPPCP
jgi:hypothetical protein